MWAVVYWSNSFGIVKISLTFLSNKTNNNHNKKKKKINLYRDDKER